MVQQGQYGGEKLQTVDPKMKEKIEGIFWQFRDGIESIKECVWFMSLKARFALSSGWYLKYLYSNRFLPRFLFSHVNYGRQLVKGRPYTLNLKDLIVHVW